MSRPIYKKRRRIRKPGVCLFCKQKITPDYKDTDNLTRVISERGKIIGRQESGVCQKHQHLLAAAVKRARFMGLLPYIVRPS